MEQNPYQPPAVGTLEPSIPAGGSELIRPLYEAKGWLKLLGVLNIVMGVLYCITIVGAIFGWIPLLLGLKANKSANELKDGFETGDGVKLQEGIRNLATCLKIIGVLTLLALILNVILIVAQVGIGVFTALRQP